MIPLDTLLLFVPAALALNLTPGNDMMFCLGQGLKSGPKAGMAAALGIAAGSLIHTLAAGIGLAALLSAHPAAFEAIRWGGVAYLAWLAVKAFLGPADLVANEGKGRGIAAAWRDAVMVSLLNPKVAVFMLAFLPQFVDPARGSTFLQFLLLGTIFNIGGTAVNLAVGGFAGSVGRALMASPRAARAFQVLTGFVFLGLAARIALERR